MPLKKQVKITESLFAHINNDPFLTGSYELTGQTFKNTIGFLQQFINDVRHTEKQLPAEVKSLFKTCKELIDQEEKIDAIRKTLDKTQAAYQCAEEWFELIQATGKSKEYVLLPGGWLNASGGHAIIYQFHRDTNDDIIFTINNSGAGLSYHAKRSEREKELYSPTFNVSYPCKKSRQ